MKRYNLFGVLIWALILLGLMGCVKKDVSPVTAGISLSYAGEAVTPILGSVTFEPVPAMLSDGTIQITYELMVSNASRSDFTIESLHVVDPERSDARILSLVQENIRNLLYLPGATKPTAMLGPSQCGYIRINLTFNDPEAVPRALDHILTVTTNNPSPPNILPKMTERVGLIPVNKEPLLIIGPPLSGDRWIAAVVGGEGYHRKTVMPLNGRWVAPERWAVDYIRLDEKNRLLTGDLSRNESYPQYEQKVLAVRDGTILDVKDGMPDLTPPNMPQNPTIQSAGGNCVLQDIGNGFAAFYAHFSPGSIKVARGERVRKGQVLGLLGNSGNSSGPHLHFHIVKGRLGIAANGFPYVVDSFKLKGQADSKDGLQTELTKPEVPVHILPPQTPGRHRNEMPADLAVVEF